MTCLPHSPHPQHTRTLSRSPRGLHNATSTRAHPAHPGHSPQQTTTTSSCRAGRPHRPLWAGTRGLACRASQARTQGPIGWQIEGRLPPSGPARERRAASAAASALPPCWRAQGYFAAAH
eukprot:scaffold14295_cov116-Isochrysis_galbana.AAC.3